MCSLCIASLKGPPIGGQENDRVSYLCSAPYTLLPLRGISPQGETRDMREKNSESYTSGIISAFSPFGGWRHHLARWEACHMTQKANPVTLTLYSSPPKGETTHYILRVASAPSKCVRCAPRGRYHNPRPEGPSNLRTFRPSGRSILRTLTPKACPKASAAPPFLLFPSGAQHPYLPRVPLPI